MPYIKQKDRQKMNMVVDIMRYQGVKADGKLNYILYKFCKDDVEPGYNNYKNFIGELRQCATEIERRILGPYEDMAIERNGDVE